MTPEEYVSMDSIALAEAAKAGDVTPEELRGIALALIKQHNPELNAVIEAYDDAPLCSDRDAPFYGVPFLMKDNNLHLEGRVSENASRLFAGNTATQSSDLVKAWQGAGLSIVGRTNLCEFAANYVTSPVANGATRNPWDTDRAPAGSSGGSAAAVAAGWVPMAHGNDAGGSIRVPAAATGLFGFKPSAGRTSTLPHFDCVWEGLNTEHVLTRSVRDSALALDVASRNPEPAFLNALGATDRPLRIGRVDASLSGAPADADSTATLDQACALLAGLGHEIIEAVMPAEVDTGPALLNLIAFGVYEVISSLPGTVEDHLSKIEAANAALYSIGSGMSAQDLLDARRARQAARLAMTRFVDGFDLLVTHAVAGPPPLIGACDANADDFNMPAFLEEIFSYAPFTAPFNASGHPAATVPVHVSPDNLPFSVQLVANPGEDALLLRSCHRLAEAVGRDFASPFRARVGRA